MNKKMSKKTTPKSHFTTSYHVALVSCFLGTMLLLAVIAASVVG